MIAGKYDKLSKKFDETYSRTIQKSLPYLNAADSVLDIACGTGIITIRLASHVSSITAIDTSPNMISILKTKASERSLYNVTCINTDIFSLPTKQYDAVLCMNVLHFIPALDPFLKRAVSLLKNGGYFITAIDCLAETSTIGGSVMTGLQKTLSLMGIIPRMHFFTSDEFVETVTGYGLNHVESEIIHPAPANLFAVFRK